VTTCTITKSFDELDCGPLTTDYMGLGMDESSAKEAAKSNKNNKGKTWDEGYTNVFSTSVNLPSG
jgi:hypothetical protein